MKDVLFSGYIARNFAGGRFTDNELRVLKEGNLESMVATFIKMKNERYIQQLQCALKSFKYYLGEDLALEEITAKREYDEHFVGCQQMDGDEDVFFGIGGSEQALLEIASRFADEDFTEFDADVYDAVCELINCTNGMFATKLSDEEVEVVLRPPVFYGNTQISAEKGLYIVTLKLNDVQFNVILSLSDHVNIVSK